MCGIGGRWKREVREVRERGEHGGAPEETFAISEEVGGDVGGFR